MAGAMNAATKAYLEDVVREIEQRFKRRGWTTGKKKWEQRLLDGAKQILADHAKNSERAKRGRQRPDCPGQTFVPGTELLPGGTGDLTQSCPSTTTNSASPQE